MKYRLQNVFLLLSSAAAVLLPTEISACGPYFQPHYINGRSPYPTVLHRKLAVRRLIADMEDQIPSVPKIPDGVTWKAAIEQDFTAAVDRYLPKLPPSEKQKLIRDYLKFMQDRRTDLKEIIKIFRNCPGN